VHQESNKDANGLSFRMKLLTDQRMHERFTGAELGNLETQHLGGGAAAAAAVL